MFKAKSKEEFDKLQASIAEQETKRREIKSSLPPRSEWVTKREPVSFNDVYVETSKDNQSAYDAREVEIAANHPIQIPWSMLPPNDRLRIEEKRKHWEDERLQLEALQAKVLEYQNNVG
jgi:hypothetical protein